MFDIQNGKLVIKTKAGAVVALDMDNVPDEALAVIRFACNESLEAEDMIEGLENELEDERATIKAMKEENDQQSLIVGKVNDILSEMNQLNVKALNMTS